jgi:hypothetical protein
MAVAIESCRDLEAHAASIDDRFLSSAHSALCLGNSALGQQPTFCFSKIPRPSEASEAR